ncbi:TIGR04211 family SH3 domain-containing protein [Shewanella sp.]|uniref:TIGR04211 family SH3 domain-containing protein n=1 Tax=Shewanella sp. TaxID=50422 RepID=UPI003569B3B8
MLRPLFVAGALLLSPALMAESQPRFISDNIYVYMHNGPGTSFRILGSVSAGTPVTFTGETADEYAKIIDNRGREGWVRADALSSDKSLRQQLEEAEQALAESQAALVSNKTEYEDVDGTISALREQLAKADELVRIASAEKVSAQEARDKALAEVQSLKENERVRHWQEGGIIAAIGLLLGVILVYLPKPQRKRRSRWMN